MTRLAISVIALTIATGCHRSQLIWSGRTPDRQHRVEVVDGGGSHYLVIDGRRRAAYRAIAARSIAFATDGTIAFAAQRGRHWIVVSTGHPSEQWDSIGELVFGPGGRLVYAAERAGSWHVVDDGVPGPRFDVILAGSLRFSRDGRRLGYVGRDGGYVRVVVDGTIGATFDGIGQLTIAGDGAHVAYAARRGQGAHLVVDGEIGPPWRAVSHVTLSPTGGRVAYAARDARSSRIIVDGEPGPAVDQVSRIVFRNDGRHLAWTARVDGREVLALDGIPIAAATSLRHQAVGFRAIESTAAAGLAYVMPTESGEQVVVERIPGARFDQVGDPVWSADGRIAYPARRGAVWMMVVDRKQLPGGSWVSAPVFSSDGRRLAYLVRRGHGWYAVVDGRDHRFDLVVDDTLAFSSDGTRWSVVAGNLAHEQLFFAIDGVTRVPLPANEIYSGSIGFNPFRGADNLLLMWSLAEANRAAAAAVPK